MDVTSWTLDLGVAADSWNPSKAPRALKVWMPLVDSGCFTPTAPASGLGFQLGNEHVLLPVCQVWKSPCRAIPRLQRQPRGSRSDMRPTHTNINVQK